MVDTPNLVLRRWLGLPESRDSDSEEMDRRVTALLDALGRLIGETPQVYLSEQGYAFLSDSEKVVAYIRPRKGQLIIGATRESAAKAGINSWENEFENSRMYRVYSVRWYAPNGDPAAVGNIVDLLAVLWNDRASKDTVQTPSESGLPHSAV